MIRADAVERTARPDRMLLVVEKCMMNWELVLWSKLCLIIKNYVEVVVRGCGEDGSPGIRVGWGK